MGFDYRRMLMKSDQELTIVVIRDTIKFKTPVEVSIEESTEGENESNGPMK